jgi:putative transcriptional regulator
MHRKKGDYLEIVKNRVKELREQKGLSQEELGQKLEVSRWTIIRIEQERYAPSVQLALKLVGVFGLSRVEDLFWLEKNADPGQKDDGVEQ